MTKLIRVTIIEHTVREFVTNDFDNFDPYDETTYVEELKVSSDKQEHLTDRWEFV